MCKPKRDVTELLHAWSSGDKAALNQLAPMVEAELRKTASAYLARERPGHTLESSALVNETFLRLMQGRAFKWTNRTQFFAIAAHLMRQILVDHARRRDALKRGGAATTLVLDEAIDHPGPRPIEVRALDDALRDFSRIDPRKGQLVELRYFAGLQVKECAAILGVSPATVKRDWAVARAWLYGALTR